MPLLPFSLSTSCGRITGLGELNQALVTLLWNMYMCFSIQMAPMYLHVWGTHKPGYTCGHQRTAVVFVLSFHGVTLSTPGLVPITFTPVDILSGLTYQCFKPSILTQYSPEVHWFDTCVLRNNGKKTLKSLLFTIRLFSLRPETVCAIKHCSHSTVVCLESELRCFQQHSPASISVRSWALWRSQGHSKVT